MTRFNHPSRQVAIFTSGRQDWSILRPVFEALREAGDSPLLLAGGLHGRDGVLPTELDGCPVNAAIAGCADGSDGIAAAFAAAQTLSSLAETLAQWQPRCLVVVGDRSETLAAAQAALLAAVPLVHLHGGETSAGAIDDAIRHAVSQLADLHCPATPRSAERLRAMGLPSERIRVCGAAGLDALFAAVPLSPAALRRQVGLSEDDGPLILLTYHPATWGEDAASGIAACCQGLDRVISHRPDLSVLATRANNDAGGQLVNEQLERWCAGDPAHRRLLTALGAAYHPALLAVDLMLGNSSSGIIEAPAAGLPVVNVGQRQAGRERAGYTVLDVAADAEAIAAAVLAQLAQPRAQRLRRPAMCVYGDGRAAPRIAAAIRDHYPAGDCDHDEHDHAPAAPHLS